MKGLYFDDSDEPEGFSYLLQHDLAEKMKKDGVTYIKLDFDSINDYYDALQAMTEFLDEKVSVSGTSRTNHYEAVIEALEDIDESRAENKTDEKKKPKKKDKDVEEEIEPIEI